MIFVTVGAQLPFDRLIHAVDEWAARTGCDDVFAQIGASRTPPKHIKWTNMLDPVDFRQYFWQADLIIAHAGAGTILTAMEMSKPLLVMPRCAEQSETRSNHQFATSRAFGEQTNLRVASNEHDLDQILNSREVIQPLSRIGSFASPQLLDTVRSLIETGDIKQPNLRLVPGQQPAGHTIAVDESSLPRRKAA